MPWYGAFALMLGAVLGAMAVGMPVAFAFFAANIVGALVFLGPRGLGGVPTEIMEALATFALAPIPLFVLMGEILFHTGVAFKAIGAIDLLIRRVPGRIAVVAVAGGTVFSALTGSTIANTALLGSVLLPEMQQRGYHPSISMGPIMAVGGVAMLIPPSALAVLLGSLASIPVSQLLIAGIVPGLMMSALFFGYIVLRCWLDPALAPTETTAGAAPASRWRPFFVYVAPLFAIFAVVVGSIFAGIAGPTESAALGCVASAAACACYRSLSWSSALRAMRETAKVTTMILFIIAGSLTFSQILAISGATSGLLQALTVLDLSPTGAVVLMLAILLLLGAFMDQVSMLLLTLPFFLPLAGAHGIDPLWFGVLMLIVMEVSLLTPPFGLLLFVMNGITPFRTTVTQVYAAATPFVLLELLVLTLLVVFPALALWLPGLIR